MGGGIQARTYQEARDNVLLLTALLEDRLPVIVLDEGIYNGFSSQLESGIEKTRVLYRMEGVVQKTVRKRAAHKRPAQTRKVGGRSPSSKQMRRSRSASVSSRHR